jgi:hypothetical protein
MVKYHNTLYLLAVSDYYTPYATGCFHLAKIREKLDASELHDLKRNGRRGNYAATKTLENDDNRLVLNVSHSFAARKPRRRVGLPQF